jgi:hypothetical protein
MNCSMPRQAGIYASGVLHHTLIRREHPKVRTGLSVSNQGRSLIGESVVFIDGGYLMKLTKHVFVGEEDSPKGHQLKTGVC